MQKLLMNMSRTKTSISNKKKVFVGLSGGVDSAVSASLLKRDGFDVTGVFIKAWQPEWLPCTWREERREAMRVCLSLDIPFLFLDLEKEYKEGVVDRMLSEYRAGRTPNPDVLCNREVKFGHFWEFAKKHGADFIATGHYAQIDEEGNLLQGKDSAKDQSYFLWTLTKSDLEHTLFPIGHLKKEEVRDLARKFNLPVANKPDSQGICFMGEVSMSEFLSHYIGSNPGPVLNLKGEKIGEHQGLVYYTIGERRGFEIKKKGEASGPFYVVRKEVSKNALAVSDKEEEIIENSPKSIRLKDLNLRRDVSLDEKLEARVRYHGERLAVSLDGERVQFKNGVKGLSFGQSIVFYSGEECLGGAVMDGL